jgi:hypothetical protein
MGTKKISPEEHLSHMTQKCVKSIRARKTYRSKRKGTVSIKQVNKHKEKKQN